MIFLQWLARGHMLAFFRGTSQFASLCKEDRQLVGACEQFVGVSSIGGRFGPWVPDVLLVQQGRPYIK